MSRLLNHIKPYTNMSASERQALVEHIRKDRTTSKAVLKKTTKKQRVNAAVKLENMLANMSDKERMKLLKIMGVG